MSNKTLNLDISKEPKINPIIYGRVGDDDSQRITVNTSKRDEQLDLTGYTITFEGVTSGGKTKVFDSDNVVSTSDGLKKGTFDYVFPNMAFAVTGKYERAYFSFIKNDIRDTSGEIEIIVLDNADIDAPEAETIITEYNKLVAELNELQKNNIADLQEQQDTYIQSTDTIQTRLSELAKRLNELELGVRLHDAYAWSADGTDRFTKVYPGENLILGGWQSGSFGWSTGSEATNSEMQRTGFLAVSGQNKYVLSLDGMLSNANIFEYDENKMFIGSSSESFQPRSSIITKSNTRFIRLSIKSTITSKRKMESGSTPTIYTPAPSEDPINAYPTYKGISIADSDNPADYSWQAEDNTIAKKVTLDSHTENISNPHKVTKTQVGLGNVDNYSTANQLESEAGTATNKFVNPLGVKQFYDKQATQLAAEMLNEIIRRSPQTFEVTFVDKTVTNNSDELTPLSGMTNQINTDPTRFLTDGTVIFISKEGTYSLDLTCSIVQRGTGTYFGFRVLKDKNTQGYPGQELKGWAGTSSSIAINGTTNFKAGDQIRLFTYPPNAKFEFNNLRLRLTYRGDDSQ